MGMQAPNPSPLHTKENNRGNHDSLNHEIPNLANLLKDLVLSLYLKKTSRSQAASIAHALWT